MKKITFFCFLLLLLLLSSSSVVNTSKYFAHDEDLKPPNTGNPIDNHSIDEFIIYSLKESLV